MKHLIHYDQISDEGIIFSGIWWEEEKDGMIQLRYESLQFPDKVKTEYGKTELIFMIEEKQCQYFMNWVHPRC